MAETNEAQKKNLFSLFPRIGLNIPFLNRNPKPELKSEKAVEVVAAEETEKPSTARVSFPIVTPKVAEQLEVEAKAEAGAGRTSNPVVLWQIYALGGFLVLRWVWARWMERKERGAKKDPPDEEEQFPPADDEQFPLPDNEDFHECR